MLYPSQKKSNSSEDYVKEKLVRVRLHEQIKHALFAQIRPELLHTDREFEELKEVLFAHVNSALTRGNISYFFYLSIDVRETNRPLY